MLKILVNLILRNKEVKLETVNLGNKYKSHKAYALTISIQKASKESLNLGYEFVLYLYLLADMAVDLIC